MCVEDPIFHKSGHNSWYCICSNENYTGIQVNGDNLNMFGMMLAIQDNDLQGENAIHACITEITIIYTWV